MRCSCNIDLQIPRALFFCLFVSKIISNPIFTLPEVRPQGRGSCLKGSCFLSERGKNPFRNFPKAEGRLFFHTEVQGWPFSFPPPLLFLFPRPEMTKERAVQKWRPPLPGAHSKHLLPPSPPSLRRPSGPALPWCPVGARARAGEVKGVGDSVAPAAISGTGFLEVSLGISQKRERERREKGGKEEEREGGKHPRRGRCLTSFHSLVGVNRVANHTPSLRAVCSPPWPSCLPLLCASLSLFSTPLSRCQ